MSTTDYDRTVAFYDAVLAAIGAERCVDMVAHWNTEWPTQRICAYGPAGKPIYWIAEARESQSARHVAFAAENEDAVRAFHAAGLAAGGTDNGEPGPRPIYHPGYFGGFLLDPEGNNVEAVFHGHQPAE